MRRVFSCNGMVLANSAADRDMNVGVRSKCPWKPFPCRDTISTRRGLGEHAMTQPHRRSRAPPQRKAVKASGESAVEARDGSVPKVANSNKSNGSEDGDSEQQTGRADGAGDVHVVGPSHTCRHLAAQAYIMHWQYPRVCVTEQGHIAPLLPLTPRLFFRTTVCQCFAERLVVYEDEHVAIQALVAAVSDDASASSAAKPQPVAPSSRQPRRGLLALFQRDWHVRNGGRHVALWQYRLRQQHSQLWIIDVATEDAAHWVHQHLLSNPSDATPDLVIHLAPTDVTSSPTYQNILATLASAYHLFVRADEASDRLWRVGSTWDLRAGRMVDSQVNFGPSSAPHTASGLVRAPLTPIVLTFLGTGSAEPSKAFVAAAMHVQVMIHEATFNSALQDHALRKRHSTMEEALSVAQRAQARWLICTHFSQR
ncbi:uncharacterized protein MONBRDRAFT_8923 [Monosiga brevicollis MX1]|uniref:ribonuclease Z n=1 Tax=Monosiga brevicollis TaxID=81824 RepID=A9V1J1_MONBE|nr:uncharacterized protein MONBRDRAFT_8923 [Monosiga brevicollis MX1]EDQ88449.1 predicted protein [Monosiga brevicollis MX1]|eukprot:XP_001746553.1 hypothetical protein [Monosiga brevicollis MX1]